MQQDSQRDHYKENLEIIQSFRLMDDTFFAVCLDNNPACAELILQIILDKDDLHVLQVKTQYSIKNLQGHSATLDALAVDSQGRHYNIEIQRRDKDAHPKRARYYSSLMDGKLLEKGQDYARLAETYVIFITENDILNAHLPLYHVERIILETGMRFGDEAHILYVNASRQNDSRLGRLMHDFCCSDPQSMHYPALAELTSRFKTEEREVTHMSALLDKALDKAIERATAEERARWEAERQQMIEQFETELAEERAKAEAEERAKAEAEERAKAEAEERVKIRENAIINALKMLRSGKLTHEEIAEYTGLSLGDVQTYAAITVG